MAPEFPFRGEARRWYLVPFIIGLCLMALSILIVLFPIILVLLVAIPLFAMGLGLALFGLDVWHGMPNWRRHVHNVRWTQWTMPPDEDDRP